MLHQGTRKPKISEPNMPRSIDEDIRRFEVAVDDAAAVHKVDAKRNLHGIGLGKLKGQHHAGTSGNQLRQCTPLDIVQGKNGKASGVEGVFETNDEGMAAAGRQHRPLHVQDGLVLNLLGARARGSSHGLHRLDLEGIPFASVGALRSKHGTEATLANELVLIKISRSDPGLR